jgi:hypothetical protein
LRQWARRPRDEAGGAARRGPPEIDDGAARALPNAGDGANGALPLDPDGTWARAIERLASPHPTGHGEAGEGAALPEAPAAMMTTAPR